MNAGPKELNEGFVRSLPDNGPVVMVNLLRFKKESADGDGLGWDAYARYSKAIPPLLKGVGGTILWAGNIECAAYGDLNAKHWEFVVLVRYAPAVKEGWFDARLVSPLVRIRIMDLTRNRAMVLN